jgi:hypothetical protein
MDHTGPLPIDQNGFTLFGIKKNMFQEKVAMDHAQCMHFGKGFSHPSGIIKGHTGCIGGLSQGNRSGDF